MKRRRKSRPRGTVFEHGRHVWIAYSDHGRKVRENTRQTDREVAEDLLKQRLAESDLRRGPATGPVPFERMMELVRADYTDNKRRSLGRLEYSIARLSEHFARTRMESVTRERLRAYVAARTKDGVVGGTVRLELAALRRGYRLAVAEELLQPSDVPAFPTIKPGDPRTGFLEVGDVERVTSRLPESLRPVVWFAFHTGWRKGEVLGLQWKSVDLEAQVIRIEGKATKNNQARTLPYGWHPALAAIIHEQDEARKALLRETGRFCPWVFHREGRPIRDLYHAWREACRAAGVPASLFHDLRRSAVRNMERAGVSRSVAMKVSGHKSETVYRRYAIVSESDIGAGLARLAGHFGHNSGTSQEVSEVADGSEAQPKALRGKGIARGGS